VIVMGSVTVNLSFQDSLLAEIDQVARKESRSRSELIREAARMYIERKRRWDDIFALGESVRESRGISQQSIAAEIAAHRKGK